MRTAINICSLILRCAELISATVVAGLVGFVIYHVHCHNGDQDARLIYTEVVAGLGILISLILLPPLPYTFKCFWADAVMFAHWVVAFALLAHIDISNTCSSTWFYTYWGWYWNRWWQLGPDAVLTHHSCSEWRAVLAFSFLSFICFFASGCIGFWNYFCHRDEAAEVNNGRLFFFPKGKRLQKNTSKNGTAV